MKEATFSTEVIRSIRHFGGWAFKIPDMPITKELMKITRFTVAKPCDIFASIGGQAVAIETKQFKKWKALSKNDFRPEQLDQLTSFVEQGKGRAFVFLNIRIKANKKENIKHDNRLIIFDWETWGPRIKERSIFAVNLKARPYYKPFNHDEKILHDLTEWLMFL